MNRKELNIALVDDHMLFCNLLAQDLIRISENHIRILFIAADGRDMQEQIREQGIPEVLLMDLQMKGKDGYESTRWLKLHYPEVRVLALSGLDDTAAIEEVMACGARGFIAKRMGHQKIYEAIVDMRDTGRHFNEYVTPGLCRKVKTMQQPEALGISGWLNEYRKKFLTLYCQDITLEEIAERMRRSRHTVKHLADEVHPVTF